MRPAAEDRHGDRGLDRPVTAEAPTRGKVFISYSRRDLAFADRLCEALKTRGFEPLIDRSDIYVFEEWWPRLQALVMQADTILFVLSPASVGSRVCGDEVNYAAGLNKRFAPLLYQKVDNAQVPEALRRLNYLHFDDPERFDQNLETLIEALTIDIEWVRKHTEWGALARRWKEAGKPGPRGLLLRPPPLEDAERWIALRPAGAPMPTEETQAFIAESRRAETRRRNVMAASVAFAAILLVTAGAALFIARQSQDLAEERRLKALTEESRRFATLSRTELDAGSPSRAALIAVEGTRLFGNRSGSDESDAALLAAYARSAWLQGPVMVHRDQVDAAAFVPGDDRKVMTASSDGTLCLWDAATGTRVGEPLVPNKSFAITGLFFSPDGRHFVTTSDREAQLYVTEGVRLLGRMEHSRPVWSVAFSGDSRRFATASSDGYARVWDTETGDAVGDALLHQRTDGLGSGDQIASIDLDRTGSHLVVITLQNEAWLWEIASSKQIGERKPGVNTAKFSPDGQRLLLSGNSGAELWDSQLKQRIAGFERETWQPKLVLHQAIFSPDGNKVLTLGYDNGTSEIELWDAATYQRRTVIRDPSRVHWVVFNGDGSRLATAGDDDQARVWEAATGLRVGPLIRDEKYWPFSSKPNGIGLDTTEPGAIRQVRFSADGNWLVTASRNGFAQLWDARSFSPVDEPPEPRSKDLRTLFSADGSLGVEVHDKDVRVIDLDGATEGRVFDYPSDIERARVSANGKYLITVTADRLVGVRTIEDGDLIFRGRHQERPFDADLSPDGTTLASLDGWVHLWDVANRKHLRTIEQPRGFRSVTFAPDGKRLATTDSDGAAKVWSIETGEAVAKSMQHDFNMQSGMYDDIPVLSFSGDGSRILTASSSTLRLWDVVAGELVAARTHAAQITSAVFSPDGKRILSSSADGTVKLWNAATLTPIRTFTHRGAVFAIDFEKNASAGAERIVTLSFAEGITIWDVATAAPLVNIDTRGVLPVFDKGRVSFSADGTIVAASSANGIRRWAADRALWPRDRLPLLAYLSAFPALTSSDRTRYLEAAGQQEAIASRARDLCDTMAADLFFKPTSRRGYGATVTSITPREREPEVLRVCRTSQETHPDNPHFGYQVGRVLVRMKRQKEALQEFEKAAAAGDVDATVAIGQVYLDPLSGLSNPQKAIEIYQKAAAAGIGPGQRELAKLHLEGKDIGRDRNKAAELLAVAARQGDGEAARLLAELRENADDRSLPADYGEAILYWSLAVEIAERAGLEDRYAAARRASLARHFRDENDPAVLERTWLSLQAAISALNRQSRK